MDCPQRWAGREQAHTRMNIAPQTGASSLLAMRPRTVEIHPEAAYSGTELIDLKRADEAISELLRPDDVGSD